MLKSYSRSGAGVTSGWSVLALKDGTHQENQVTLEVHPSTPFVMRVWSYTCTHICMHRYIGTHVHTCTHIISNRCTNTHVDSAYIS